MENRVFQKEKLLLRRGFEWVFFFITVLTETKTQHLEGGNFFLREILFTPSSFLFTPHITHTTYLLPISLMGCIEKRRGCI